MAEDGPVDPGLHVERTLLAWRRTALAVAVVSAAGVRFTAPLLGWAAVALGAAGVLCALAAYFFSTSRYRQVHRALRRSASIPGNGWPQITLALATLVLGLVAAAFVVVVDV